MYSFAKLLLGGQFLRRWYLKPSTGLFDKIIAEINLLPNRQLEVKYDRECESIQRNINWNILTDKLLVNG